MVPPARALAALPSLGLEADVEQRFLADNARRVFNI
jgi:hypothetical protein